MTVFLFIVDLVLILMGLVMAYNTAGHLVEWSRWSGPGFGWERNRADRARQSFVIYALLTFICFYFAFS